MCVKPVRSLGTLKNTSSIKEIKWRQLSKGHCDHSVLCDNDQEDWAYAVWRLCLRLGHCCVELHYGNALGTLSHIFWLSRNCAGTGLQFVPKNTPTMQSDTTPTQSQAQPKNGQYTSFILTLQALRMFSINFLPAMSMLYKTEWLKELSNWSSPKMDSIDSLTTSLHYFYKKCIGTANGI